MSEEWNAVVLYDGLYAVSSLGRVRRERDGMIFKPQPIALGHYMGVRLTKAGRTVNHRIADLVMAAFVGPKEPGIEVNHKNGVHADNSLANLEYVTKRQQEDHAVANALHAWGERHGMAKLTADIVRLIRISAESNRTLADRYGVGIAAIRNARSGETWKHLDTEFDKTAKAYQGKQDLGICDECGGQFSDLEGHKSLGVQTHPWLKATDLNFSNQPKEDERG